MIRSLRQTRRSSLTRSRTATVIPLAPSSNFRPLSTTETQSVLTRYAIDTPYILYVGSAAARKNLPGLLEAFALVRECSIGWKLVIVGPGEDSLGSISAAITRLKLQGGVLLLGSVAEADLPALYNRASAFVFTSLIEGYGLPVIEAMACGTPVITSATTSLPEVAGDAAVLVDPGNVAAIAGAIKTVLNQPDLAAALRASGLRRAAQFTWESTAIETIRVYQQALDVDGHDKEDDAE